MRATSRFRIFLRNRSGISLRNMGVKSARPSATHCLTLPPVNRELLLMMPGKTEIFIKHSVPKDCHNNQFCYSNTKLRSSQPVCIAQQSDMQPTIILWLGEQSIPFCMNVNQLHIVQSRFQSILGQSINQEPRGGSTTMNKYSHSCHNKTSQAYMQTISFATSSVPKQTNVI